MGHRIDIRVGYQCNNHCQFCIQGDARYRLSDKSTQELRAILQKRRKDNDEVVFTGGEVTIRKDFFDLVACAGQLGYRRIQIQSNGRMFAYKDFCARAVEAGANDFVIAIHGSKKRIHDSLTLAPGSFNETIRGIKNLKKLGQRVTSNTVISKSNYKDLPNIARLLVVLGVVQYQFAFMHICKQIGDNPSLVRKIIPRKSAVSEYVKKGLQIGLDNDRVALVQALPYCFLDGYENCLSERFVPQASIEEELFIRDFVTERKEKGKIKGPQCPQCKYDVECEGPWKEYPQIFGWDEFKPIEG